MGLAGSSLQTAGRVLSLHAGRNFFNARIGAWLQRVLGWRCPREYKGLLLIGVHISFPLQRLALGPLSWSFILLSL